MRRSPTFVRERVRIPRRPDPTLQGVVEVGPAMTIDALLRAIRAAGSHSLEILADSPGRALDSQGRVAMLAFFLREEGYHATLVTRDAALAAAALDVGIPVSGHTSSAAPAPRAAARPVFQAIAAPTGRHAPAVRTARLWDRPLVPWPLLARLALIAAAAIAVYLAIVFYLAPSATVVLTPDVRLTPFEATVRVDPDAGAIDFAQRLIPATVVEAVVQDSLTKPTTGRRREAESFATGQVTLRNRTREAVIVPRGTRVTAAGAVGFITEAEVLIPPTLPVSGKPVPGEWSVAVTAEESGPGGNLPALAITGVDGPLAGALDAFNVQPMQGGSEREVALVSQRDVDELAAVLEERVQSAAVERLRRDRPDNQTLVVWSPQAGNPQIIAREFSADVDERATTLSLDLTLRARATSFSNADLEEVLREIVAQTPAQQTSDLDRVRVIETQVASDRWGVLELHVRAVGEAATPINPDDVRAALAGRSLDEGASLLAAMPGVAGYRVKHDPSDTANFPRLGFRIDVQIAPSPPAAPV